MKSSEGKVAGTGKVLTREQAEEIRARKRKQAEEAKQKEVKTNGGNA